MNIYTCPEYVWETLEEIILYFELHEKKQFVDVCIGLKTPIFSRKQLIMLNYLDVFPFYKV
jgi:hypothetical protein